MSNDILASSPFLMLAAGILVMVLVALMMVNYASKAQKKMLQQQMENQALELKHQQDLVAHNLQTQEDERRRIAANLHDDIGSKLGVLHLTFHRLRRTGGQAPQYDSLCQEIDELIDITMNRARQISHELMPPILDAFGLIVALKELCEQINRAGAVNIDLDIRLDRTDIGNSATELHLYRILQELTTNTLKYAEARTIKIKLEKSGDRRRLYYTDDGKGFNTESTVGRGLGIKNLESRARTIHASWNLTSSPGKGVEVVIEW